MSNQPGEQPFNVKPNHVRRRNSKFTPGSIAHSRREVVLREIRVRISRKQSFGDLQDPAKQNQLIERHAPRLAHRREE